MQSFPSIYALGPVERTTFPSTEARTRWADIFALILRAGDSVPLMGLNLIVINISKLPNLQSHPTLK